jgi:hypothetical protein
MALTMRGRKVALNAQPSTTLTFCAKKKNKFLIVNVLIGSNHIFFTNQNSFFMNNFLNFRLPRTMCPPAHLLRLSALFVLIGLFGPSSTSAQGTELFQCPESEYTFSGSPQETLCGENPNFVCQTQLGAGTQFPKSSLWGASISGNVCIVGDFEVDNAFSFQNAIVKINPGVTIAVKPSPNGFDPGSSLGIDNSKLFACSGLWKGITLGHLSNIGTQNNSEIEDAETAIRATGLCALFIQQTTFNRNRVGIELVTAFPSVFIPGPLVLTFSNNHFTCDAPLNGTANEITYAGIKLNNSVLFTFQSGPNTFTDIQYGIYSVGSASYIGVDNFIFQQIRHDGIYMEVGNMNLRSSQFQNVYENGINIETANNVSISKICNFIWDHNIPIPLPNQYHQGIYINKFAVGSMTNITENLFSADFSIEEQQAIGVRIAGASVAGGTSISMTKNTWHMYGGPNNGVRIFGNFPSGSHIDIIDNDFDIQELFESYSPRCIYSQGDKYDFDIKNNRFYNSPPIFGWVRGMDLSGSDGIGNQVSENNFEQGTYLYSFITGILATDFKNTNFCSNTFLNSNQAFYFAGKNDGTNFTRNIAYGSQLIHIGNQAWIEDQDQKLNQWTAEYQGSIFPFVVTPNVRCADQNFANFSEFFVHTAQSTALFGPGFNPFHPKNIIPDNTVEWWIQQSGTPAGPCMDQIVGPGNGDSNLKRAIADGTLAAQFNNDPSMIWQAQRSLYFALKRTPALENEYAAYSTFLTAKTGSNIDKFYQVFTGLDAARNGSTTLVANAETNRAAIDNLLVLIEADDLAWQNATTPVEKENAKNAKQLHLSGLMQLLQNAAGYQSSYKQGMQTALSTVQQTNSSISPVGDWEIYEKTSNDIFISYLQNDGITEGQKQQLESIAAVCPKYGGMAVYRARGILPECAQAFDQDNYEGCYPTPTPEGQVELRSDDKQVFQKIARAQVQPNPASNLTMLSIPEGKHGDIQIVNAFGQVVLKQKIVSSQTSLNLNLIPTGTYYLNIFYSDGQRDNLKLVVSR